ncbi:MAG: tetratricopeptide repeat protein [Phototrophicaceae bacterium]|jgi:tetratricopeptide (TPR) repeat protein
MAQSVQPNEKSKRASFSLDDAAVILIPIGLFLLAVTLYIGTFDAELMYSWDDQRYVTYNPYFVPDGVTAQTFAGIWSEDYFASYIPVTLTSYALEYALWGLNPAGYHIVNVLLHGLVGVLTYYLLRHLSGHPIVAGIATVLFIVHPVNVESVAWIAERKNLLGMLFFIITFLAHIRSGVLESEGKPARAWGWLALCYGLFTVTMFSKTAAIGAPLLFFLYDWEWRKIHPIKAALRVAPYAPIVIIAAWVQIVAHRAVDGIKPAFGQNVLDRIRLFLVVAWEYLVSLVAPFDLNNMYIYSVADIRSNWFGLLLGAAFILSLLALALFGQRLGRMVSAWIVVFMLPVSNIISIAIQRADRYMYFVTPVVFLLVGVAVIWLWYRMTDWRQQIVLAGLVGGIILAPMALTVPRIEVWDNEGALWRDHRETYPTSNTGLLNEGVYYFAVGDYRQAEFILTRLVNLHPTTWKGYRLLGRIAHSEERWNDAVRNFQLSWDYATQQGALDEIGIEAVFGESLFNAGLARHNLGDYDGANALYQRASQYMPNNPALYNNIGFNFFTAGAPTPAIEAYQAALKLNADYLLAYRNLLTAANSLGNTELATFATENIVRLGGTP